MCAQANLDVDTIPRPLFNLRVLVHHPAHFDGTVEEQWLVSMAFGDTEAGGAGHWVYDPLAADRRVGVSRLRFIEDGNWYSSQDMMNVSANPPDDLFLAILRACPRKGPPFSTPPAQQFHVSPSSQQHLPSTQGQQRRREAR